ncbi:MAG TPA: hypothetical protein VF187_11215 [Gemmatimonadales bacterium]
MARLAAAAAAERRITEGLDQRLEEARAARLPMERVWLENIAFFLGHQWVQWDPVHRRMAAPHLPPWRVLLSFNMIHSTIRTEFAKLTKQMPLVGVQPLSGEAADVAQAKASEKILAFLRRRTHTDEAWREAVMWALVTGTSFVKVYWDPTAGEELMPGIHIGEIAVDPVAPLEVYPDPFGTQLKDKGWLFHVKLRPPQYVFDKYGVEVEPESVSGDEYLEGRLLTLTDQQAGGPRRGVWVKEYWERPNRRFPRGRYVVYARDRVLYASDEAPYPDVPIPYVALRHIPVPGRFWGDSITSQLKDPQRNYNKARCQAIEIRNAMAKPKWLVPRGSLDRPITGAPGEMVEYNPIAGARPEPAPGRDAPPTFWRDVEQSRNEILEISGQHEVSRAQVPSGVRTGIAIAYLQEQDDTRLNPTAQELERAFEQVETYKLRLARQFYIEPRVARIVGEDRVTEVIEFTREDIPDGADVRVQAGSSLPQSRVARQEFVLELWRERLIQDPRVALRMLEFGDVEGIFEDTDLDVAQAERENEGLKQGLWHEPEDFENHLVHIHEHNRYRKTQEYDALPPEIQELFRHHVALHQQFLGQQAAGLAQLTGGGGGGIGEAEAGLGGALSGARAAPGAAQGGP